MLPFGINCRLQLAGLGKKREESVKPTCFIHLSMSSPNGGGGVRTTHGNLAVTYIPRVGILMGHHAFNLSISNGRCGREENHLFLIILTFIFCPR